MCASTQTHTPHTFTNSNPDKARTSSSHLDLLTNFLTQAPNFSSI